MNRQTFLDAFCHIADAPGGVDKLRRLVRKMAARGLLVPQIPSDEPASELLKRVAEERTQQLPSRRSRRFKLLQPVGESEHSYGARPGWEWTRLGTIFGMQAGSNVPSGTIRDSGSYPCYGGNGIRGFVESFNRDGSYPIIGRQGALCGNVKVAHGRFYATEHAVVVECFGGTSVAWAALALEAMNLNQYATATAQPGLSVERISGVPIAVPPVEEQLRIVERVDAFMALCDELEEQQAVRVDARTALITATLHRVTGADTEGDLRAAISSFAEQIDLHLAPGDGDIAALKRLRRTILDLAVRGRLTYHDPADAPIAELLGHIAAERDRRMKAKEIRNQKLLSEVPVEDYPFELPKTWVWARFGNICQSRLGKMLDEEKNTGVPRRYLRNANVQWDRFDLADVKELRLEDSELSEYDLRDGDLLVVEGGYPGRCAVWDSSLMDGVVVFQKALHRVRPEGGILSRFIALVLKNAVDTDRISEFFTGSGIQHLTGKKLVDVPIPLPPIGEQRRIVDRVAELNRRCDLLEQQFLAAELLRRDLARSMAAHVVPAGA